MICDPDTHTMEAESKPQKQKKPSQPAVTRLVCDLPSNFQLPRLGTVHYYSADSQDFPVELPYEVRLVKLKRTAEEKRRARRAYTREYTSRPEVRAKIHKRLADPEKVKARQEYAAREDVKERKKELSRRNREIRAKLKSEKPEIYAQLLSEIQARVSVAGG